MKFIIIKAPTDKMRLEGKLAEVVSIAGPVFIGKVKETMISFDLEGRLGFIVEEYTRKHEARNLQSKLAEEIKAFDEHVKEAHQEIKRLNLFETDQDYYDSVFAEKVNNVVFGNKPANTPETPVKRKRTRKTVVPTVN